MTVLMVTVYSGVVLNTGITSGVFDRFLSRRSGVGVRLPSRLRRPTRLRQLLRYPPFTTHLSRATLTP
jgi:hypothetical protein